MAKPNEITPIAPNIIFIQSMKHLRLISADLPTTEPMHDFVSSPPYIRIIGIKSQGMIEAGDGILELPEVAQCQASIIPNPSIQFVDLYKPIKAR